VAAFCAVVVAVLLVIITILALKHVQIRRREMDKSELLLYTLLHLLFCVPIVTNHREKIMATFKHER